MFKRIMKHEWRLLTADATAWLVIALFALAVGGGVYSGYRWVSFQQQTLQKLNGEERTRLDGLLAQVRQIETNTLPTSLKASITPDWGPQSPYYLGSYRGQRYAFLPPAELAVTAVGQSDLYPYYFKVSTDLKQNFASAYELENPLKLLVGRFDLAFVLLYLYPLLILALSFNLVAGEKESGTLGMLLAQPIRLGTVVLGKATVRALLAFLSVAGFAAIGLVLAGVNLARPAALARFALWALAVLLYGAFWFALALLVNARGKSSATNALTLAAAWLAFVVLLPCAVNVLATTLYPVPSRVEYIQRMRQLSDGEAAERGKQLAAFYEDHPELAKGGITRREEFALTKERLNRRMEEQMQPLTERFDAQLARQQSFVNRFRFLSPAMLMQEALYDIAGTGAARYRHFTAQVDEFHQAWKSYFYPRIAQRQLLASAQYDEIPRYDYREESIGQVSGRAAAPLLALAAFALLLGAFSLRLYQRYQII